MRARRTVGVLVNGPRLGANVTGQLRSTTRLTPTTTASLFSMIASPTRNIQVVVIDVDRLGIQPVSDLRLVFPNIRILALASNSSLQRQARQAGAMLALSPANSKLGTTIERLAHPQKACAARATKRRKAAPTVKPRPKAKPLPKAAGVLQRSLNAALAKRTIQFEAGKAVLTPSGRATLDRLLKTLKRYPKARIRIEGYTDSDGPAAQNLALSRARADAVRLYLISHGIRAASLEAVGFGESRPVASNATAAGKAKNRRIELKVTAG